MLFMLILQVYALVIKIFILCTLDKIHLKCNCPKGSIIIGVQQTILYSFVWDRLPGYRVFLSLKPFIIRKTNKHVLDAVTFYLEDDNNGEVNFNEETLTFTLQLIKI